MTLPFSLLLGVMLGYSVASLPDGLVWASVKSVFVVATLAAMVVVARREVS